MRGYLSIFKLAATALAFLSPALPQDELAELYSQAQQAQKTGDLATATRKYEAIVQLRPQMAEAYANLGNLYYQQGQSDRAKPAYEKAIHIKPDLAGPHFFLGVIAFGEHDYSPALRYLERAEALEPSNKLIHSYLGYTQYARFAFREAAGELEKAAALDAGDIDVLYHLSKSYSHLAKDTFHQLQNEFPNSVYTNRARAHAYEIEENWKPAGEQYNLALEKMPNDRRLRDRSQWIAAKVADASAPSDAGATDELIDGSLAYKDSQVSGPKLKGEMTQWQSKMRALDGQRRSDKQVYRAAEGYQVLSYLSSLAVFESDPDSYRSHQLRAQLLEASNKEEDAIAEYRNLINLAPDDAEAYYNLGVALKQKQDFDGAIAALEKAIGLEPGLPEAHYTLGVIFWQQGKLDEAAAEFRAAIRLRPTFAEAHKRLGITLRRRDSCRRLPGCGGAAAPGDRPRAARPRLCQSLQLRPHPCGHPAGSRRQRLALLVHLSRGRPHCCHGERGTDHRGRMARPHAPDGRQERPG